MKFEYQDIFYRFISNLWYLRIVLSIVLYLVFLCFILFLSMNISTIDVEKFRSILTNNFDFSFIKILKRISFRIEDFFSDALSFLSFALLGIGMVSSVVAFFSSSQIINNFRYCGNFFILMLSFYIVLRLIDSIPFVFKYSMGRAFHEKVDSLSLSEYRDSYYQVVRDRVYIKKVQIYLKSNIEICYNYFKEFELEALVRSIFILVYSYFFLFVAIIIDYTFELLDKFFIMNFYSLVLAFFNYVYDRSNSIILTILSGTIFYIFSAVLISFYVYSCTLYTKAVMSVHTIISYSEWKQVLLGAVFFFFINIILVCLTYNLLAPLKKYTNIFNIAGFVLYNLKISLNGAMRKTCFATTHFLLIYLAKIVLEYERVHLLNLESINYAIVKLINQSAISFVTYFS